MTSLVVQWLRIHLPMQGTWVQSLVRKIPYALEQLSHCAASTEPDCWSPYSAAGEAGAVRGPAPQGRAAPAHCSQRKPITAAKTQLWNWAFG